MKQHVALLRGINVGGNTKIGMSDLRTLLTGLGYEDVKTLLQSGNAVFASEESNQDKLAAEIEKAIAAELGLNVRVLVRDRAYLQRIADADPFSDIVTNPSRYSVVFCSGRPELAKVLPLAAGGELAEPGENALYVWFPEGIGRSKLGAAMTDRKLGVDVVTVRNWNTVTKLLDMMGP